MAKILCFSSGSQFADPFTRALLYTFAPLVYFLSVLFLHHHPRACACLQQSCPEGWGLGWA